MLFAADCNRNCQSGDADTCECLDPNDTSFPCCTDAADDPGEPAHQLNNVYSVNGIHGGVVFIGNSLGLIKICGENVGSGSNLTGSIGAFITTDNSKQVDSYPTLSPSATDGPAGTTLNFLSSSSAAVLNLPPNSTILHAHLIWSGSYGYCCGTAQGQFGVATHCILDYTDGTTKPSPVTLTTPDAVTHSITPLEGTNLNRVISQDPNRTYGAGHYTCWADVTNIVNNPSFDLTGAKFTVGGVPATVAPHEDQSNSAGWTLAIVFECPTSSHYSTANNFVAIYVGANEASDSVSTQISGFNVPSGSSPARVLASAIEGDPDLVGDHLYFGATSSPSHALSGPHNGTNNFFASQIVNYIVSDTNFGTSEISPTWTYGTYNSTPGSKSANARQGYDITNVDASSILSAGATTAYVQNTVGTGGDEYVLNAFALQLSTTSAIITPTKQVSSDGINYYNSIATTDGTTVTYKITLTNTGNDTATDIVFTDIYDTSQLTYGGTVTIVYPNSDIQTSTEDPRNGITLTESLAAGASCTITFEAYILTGSAGPIYNTGSITYSDQIGPHSSTTNETTITIGDVNVSCLKTVSTDGINFSSGVSANIGDTVYFNIAFTNSGQLPVYVHFVDPVITNLDFVTGSVTIDGTPYPSLSLPEFDLPSALDVNDTVNVQFQATITGYPVIGDVTFTNNAYGIYSSQETNISSATVTLPLHRFYPPRSVEGSAWKCKFLNKTTYSLESSWLPSISPDCIGYEVFINGNLVATLPAEGPFVFQTCLDTKQQASNITMEALYPDGNTSDPVSMEVIIH